MAKGTVVRDDVSRCGLRRLHVVRAGKAPECDEWLAEKEICEEELLARLAYEENGVGMWHLRLYWKNPSDLTPNPSPTGRGEKREET